MPTIDIAKYDRLICQLGAECHRRLPRSSTYDREDLYQEGRMKALAVADKYDPSRGTLFITLLTVSLINRYEKILYHERRRHAALGTAARLMPRVQPPGQRLVEVRAGLTVHLPDRYGRLRRPRLRIVYDGGPGTRRRRLLLPADRLDLMVEEIGRYGG